ncbi:MAG: hypothetical protein FJ217_12225 [Ignavibacteria bacterium]|nr:hypothetical protein [Ignavibacteria bacterium]
MLRVGKRRAEFVIVAATDARGLDERRFTVLHGVFSAANSDFWEFVNPATFLAFFLRPDNGDTRAGELQATLAELKRIMPDYASLGVGWSKGELVATFTWRGKIKTAPQGIARDEAIRQVTESWH